MTPEEIAKRIIDDARKGGYVATQEWDAQLWQFEHERDHLVIDIAKALRDAYLAGIETAEDAAVRAVNSHQEAARIAAAIEILRERS